jgi:beta-galactosidase
MHYPLRVPRPYWLDHMRKMRALDLNTLCPYVFWNLHEPELAQLRHGEAVFELFSPSAIR